MKDGLLRNRKLILDRPSKAAALKHAPIRHLCWCGADGHFGFIRGGDLFCRSHVVFDADGSFHTIPQS